MLHRNREQLQRDLIVAKHWLHAQSSYQNAETGRPLQPATVIVFPRSES